MESFELVILGSGPGGYVAAIRAAQLKMKVAIVEKDNSLGGTCLNVGCIPSKVLLEATENFYKAKKDFSKIGIHFQNLNFDFSKLMERKNAVVKDLTDGIALLMKKNGIKVVNGFGKLIAPHQISVKTESKEEVIECEKTLIAVGSKPFELSFLPFDHEVIIDSTDAIQFNSIPQKMVVIGAGAIGLELGSVYSRLGSKVIFIELLERIAPFADSQSSLMLQRALQSMGLEFKLKRKVVKGEKKGGKVYLTILDKNGVEEVVEADKVLVSVGRVPNTEGQNFEKIGIKMDEKKRIVVDENFETSVKSVYAIGDCIKGTMLAHKASLEGVCAVERMTGLKSTINYNAIPNVVYTNPELSQVGMTEEEAKAKGLRVKSGKSYFKGNGRAKSLLEEEGFVKVVVEEETKKLLGLHIVGARSSELIHLGAMCIEFEGTSYDLAMMCYAHPTLSESIKEAALNVEKLAIHG